ncbi:MAG: hypothetical protein GF401_01920, partial [Chitinivibrionales bacterium]|nr:hypothetical protein [Chitinivibrionales bacterium]
MSTDFKYQPPTNTCGTKDDVISLFGQPNIERKLTSFSAKKKLLGDPTSSEFKSQIKKITLPGFGPKKNQTKTLRMHSKLHKLLTSAFTNIKELVSDYELYLGCTYGTYFRYSKNSTTRNAIKNNSDYDSIRPNGDWPDWAHDCAEYDRKKNRLDGTIPYNGRQLVRRELLSNHSFGTAIDINAVTNPYPSRSRRATTSFDMRKMIIGIMEEHGFYWGGYYHDYMHFEYMLDKII